MFLFPNTHLFNFSNANNSWTITLTLNLTSDLESWSRDVSENISCHVIWGPSRPTFDIEPTSPRSSWISLSVLTEFPIVIFFLDHPYNKLSSGQDKSRWIVQGFNQVKFLDYLETFSTVCRPETYRILFVIAISNKWPILQYNVKNAFVHTDIN